MFTAKRVLYCLLALTTLTLSRCEDSTSVSIASEARGNCSCGGFGSRAPGVDAAPLVAQAPGLVVACDEAGEATCKNLCQALAMATKAKGPEILCNRLVNASNLKLSAFYQVCDRPWTYADMTSVDALCCEDAAAVPCPTTDPPTTNTTNV